MNHPSNPSYREDDYEGCVTAGRATGRPIPPPSDEDLRRAEAAWNDPAFYEFVKDLPVAAAGYVPKPIVDPDRPLIPPQKEIAKLPRWAQVAFAARCAQRVLPLVASETQDSPKRHIELLREVVGIVEATASQTCDRDLSAFYSIYKAAEMRLKQAKSEFASADARTGDAFADAFSACPRGNPRTDPAYAAARALEIVSEAAREQLHKAEKDFHDAETLATYFNFYNTPHGWHRIDDAYESVCAAASAASRSFAPELRIYAVHNAVFFAIQSIAPVVTLGTLGAIAAPAHDFARVRMLAEKEKWTDDTPVPPSVFGPMWDGPPPPWWTDEVLAGLPADPNATSTVGEQSAPANGAPITK